MKPRRVAKSYDSTSGRPLHRMIGRPNMYGMVSGVLVLALVGAVISWAAHAGDGVLTVTLFAITAPLVVAVPVVVSAGLMLRAIDEKAPIRGRALWWVMAAVAGSGVAAELTAMWLAYTASRATWFYPLIAVAVALTAIGIVLAVDALVDR
jgi:hypothetical protein